MAAILAATTAMVTVPAAAVAQNFRFNNVSVQGNQRIETGTILTYAGVERGKTLSAGELNEAYQRIIASGLFESVEIVPRGGTLVIEVVEYPTINVVSIEGNRRLKDDDLINLLKSKPRLVFNPDTAEADAQLIAEAYGVRGRLASRVRPKIIRRSDNRVDLIFEVFEGDVTEIERISFVGNRTYSDRRLRRVLETKQAGILRRLVQKDTLVADRIAFDRQLLTDFYMARGYVDFRILGVNAELAQERDGYFVSFNVEEGQQFTVGDVTVRSELDTVDEADFDGVVKLKAGQTYSPTAVEDSIARLENQANRLGLDFVRVEPRITRNDRDLSLNVEFALVRGDRIFVERIDIEGNTTTLDRVIRRQFKLVEGDPFNPREIRESAERIRALGYFAESDVQAREGSSPGQVIVDVDVEEQPTGSLSFGGTYSTNSGFGLSVSLSERNFLGRGQQLNLSVSSGEDNRVYSIGFAEPAFLGRDLTFSTDINYTETTAEFANFDTVQTGLQVGLDFPLAERSRLGLYYVAQGYEMNSTASGTPGGIVQSEIAQGGRWASGLGYTYSFDSRRDGFLDRTAYTLEFGQEVTGLGGDDNYVKTTAAMGAQTTVLNEDVTLTAQLEAGALTFLNGGSSRSVDRFNIGNGIMRGFEPDGIGPREVNGAGSDALGGNMFAVARFEAQFPLGLPEEYGLAGGLFYDVGSVWGLDNASSATGTVLYDDFTLRQVVGVSLFWETPIGPLRFNWSHALQKEAQDREQTFNFTISTKF